MSLISLIEIVRSEAGTLTLEPVTGKISRVENTHASNPAIVSCMIGTIVSRSVSVAAGRYMDFWYDGSEWKIMAEIDVNYDNLPLTGRTDDPPQVVGKYIVYFKDGSPFYRKGDGTVVAINSGSYGRKVGEIVLLPEFQEISPSFPLLCMALPDSVISQSNFPDFVPYLRNLKLRYGPLNATIHQFAITHYEILSNQPNPNTASVWLNDMDGIKIGNALVEDMLVHLGPSTLPPVDWRTITLTTAIGEDIPAGDYAISNMTWDSVNSPHTWKVSFALAHAPVARTAIPSTTVEFYSHRIAGNATAARHFAVQGRGFITVGDSEGEWIGGLRRRDRGQGHKHYTSEYYLYMWGYAIGPASGYEYSPDAIDRGGLGYMRTSIPINDGTNGPPRTGATTDIRGLGIYPYMYVGQYIP